ncbi:hypothetical protein ACRALDRAFT_2109945 [Sodiomyces alcalophilus JCM 7366]|uniref:uncharacterized protein n=1 Tax=Sodiomyces alcalophilus JCM 7366 TaxID=591952 RepID=UPI0039B382E9
MSSAAVSKSPESLDLHASLTPNFLAGIRSFWFSHLHDDESIILPNMDHWKRWFQSDPEFDQLCVKQFQPALEAIKTANPTPESLLEAANPQTPDDWLSLVLLLDQMPRNCYRGPASATVFTVFDPLALAVARRAISLGIPESPELKHYVARRSWLYLPLMHAEDLPAQEQSLAEYKRMSEDVRAFIATPSSAAASLTGEEAKCHGVLVQNKESAEKSVDMQYDFAVRHHVIIARFGRFPHRNGPLGRAPTPEEREYLEKGGETFSSSG